MEDSLECQISPLNQYHQNLNQMPNKLWYFPLWLGECSMYFNQHVHMNSVNKYTHVSLGMVVLKVYSTNFLYW